jgi:hypothetical protein
MTNRQPWDQKPLQGQRKELRIIADSIFDDV